MARFQARDDDGKGKFEVAFLIEAETQRFIAKTVVVCGMLALTAIVIVFAIRRESTQLTVVVGVISNLISFVLGRYFDRGKNG